jgi:predicted nucleic acid-binding protein
MERIYLDSSVYVKLFKEENGSDTVKQIVSYVKTNRRFLICLSYWVVNETIAAIDQACNQHHEITKKERDIIIPTIFRRLLEYSKSHVNIISVNNNLVNGSVNYIHTYNLSADDALHIHIAHESKCKYFITADYHIKRHIGTKLGGLRILEITNDIEMSELLDRIS